MDLQQSAGSVQVDIGGWIGDGFKHLSNNWGKYVRPYLTFFGVAFAGGLLMACMGFGGSIGVGFVACPCAPATTGRQEAAHPM